MLFLAALLTGTPAHAAEARIGPFAHLRLPVAWSVADPAADPGPVGFNELDPAEIPVEAVAGLALPDRSLSLALGYRSLPESVLLGRLASTLEFREADDDTVQGQLRLGALVGSALPEPGVVLGLELGLAQRWPRGRQRAWLWLDLSTVQQGPPTELQALVHTSQVGVAWPLGEHVSIGLSLESWVAGRPTGLGSGGNLALDLAWGSPVERW